MDGCATFVMDMSRTCHRIFSRCIIHALFMEQLAEALARDVTKNTRGDVLLDAVCMRGSQYRLWLAYAMVSSWALLSSWWPGARSPSTWRRRKLVEPVNVRVPATMPSISCGFT
jgi:hypothetical protein